MLTHTQIVTQEYASHLTINRMLHWDGEYTIHIDSKLINQAERHIKGLQKWLFKTLLTRKKRIVNHIATLLRKSYHNFILAFNRITHSSGAKTAGVDKVKLKYTDALSYWKAHTFWKRTFSRNKTRYDAKPLKRVYIPKPDGTQRPLGIPTHLDRIAQAVLTKGVEVITEMLVYQYKLNTFGFRPKCRTHDAINTLGVLARQGKNAVIIDMDIEKCFDQITHQYILDSLNNFGFTDYIEAIKSMLRSGYIEIDGSLHDTETGTPQGGIISPTLCNLVVRQVLDIPIAKLTRKSIEWFKGWTRINCTSYADDAIIILSPNKGIAKIEIKAKQALDWINQNLSQAGLKLKDSKTRIITDDSPFDFLGFEIRRGKGIRPSTKKLKAQGIKERNMFRKNSSLSNINAVSRGFRTYYANFSSGVMWKSLGKLDYRLTRQAWKRGIEPAKVVTYYHPSIKKTTRYMSPPKGATIFTNEKFFKDRDWKQNPRKQQLYKRQNGICQMCKGKLGGQPQLLETHHVKEKAKGGKDKNDNVILIHQSCHQLHHFNNLTLNEV